MNIGDIAAATTVAGFLAVGVVWYHENDQAGLAGQLDNIETNAVVDRLTRLYRIKCEPGSTLNPEYQTILEQQLRRYRKLAGREFTPPC